MKKKLPFSKKVQKMRIFKIFSQEFPFLAENRDPLKIGHPLIFDHSSSNFHCPPASRYQVLGSEIILPKSGGEELPSTCVGGELIWSGFPRELHRRTRPTL